MKQKNGTPETKAFVRAVSRALRRASKMARKTARAYHTPIDVWLNGKVVAKQA
ncbi:MAG: hypothetical protein KatS3mg082_1374 [Nitrospiraceae bacterium]|nr:MAG: hypothetical protein KatS3mg082_1374 [Nitrospiraceae bacterium]